MRKVGAILLTVSCSLLLISCGANNDTAKEDVKREGIFIERLEDGTAKFIIMVIKVKFLICF